MSERPSLTVVVASFRGLDVLAQCLQSLRPQCAQLGAELVLARRSDEPGPELEAVAAGCRLIAAPIGATLPELRGAGLAQARGEWVALTEDHCVAGPGWLAAFLEARSPDVQVLGGSMGNARRQRATDCGAFFAEYGFFGAVGPSRGPGAPPLITQANAAYHFSVVPQVAAWACEGSWENVIHDRLHAAGHGFRLVPGARVLQNLTYRLGEFCRDRFAHGRGYAATRAAGASAWKRLGLLAATPALPLVLGGRILRAVPPPERRDLSRGLAAMLLFLSAWALGEAAGYFRGAAR